MQRTETSTKQASEPGRVQMGSVLVLGHAVKHVFNSGLFEAPMHLISEEQVGEL